ncbi:MAG: YjbQ family protein [Alphaproteobacteria bacterium]|nr:YjbQ family protein [Alphaproteobacteria bacterium]
MKQAMTRLSIQGRGRGLQEITSTLANWVAGSGIRDGLLTAFIPHTSATLLINENADSDVARDIEDFFSGVAPENAGYRHENEGPDDMPAHIRSALTQTDLQIPVLQGRMTLGTWQGVFLFEHRSEPRKRDVVLHLLGD